MKKKILFGGLFLLAILAALALLPRSSKRIPTPYAQADVKELRERIKHLEELTASLEKKVNETPGNQVRHATFTPDGKAVKTYDDKQVRIWDSQNGKQIKPPLPAPAQPAPTGNMPAGPIPPGWKTHEFNGLTYYVVPLSR